MDFRQSAQPANSRPTAGTPAPVASEHPTNKHSGKPTDEESVTSKWTRIFSGVILIGIAIIVACVALALAHHDAGEAKYIDNGKYQAVFLNNGQVYFGNITSLNSQYVRLANVWYLTQNSGGNSSYTLVKLGCQQIHDPTDEMVINRDQVTFWENLNNDGKVVSNINLSLKQNPNGPDCSQVSNQTQASGSSAQTSQNSTNTGTGAGSNSTTSGGTGKQ